MQDEIWHQFGIQNYNGNVFSVYSVVTPQNPVSKLLQVDLMHEKTYHLPMELEVT